MHLAPFAFSLYQIPIGATIKYCNRADEKLGLTYTAVDYHNVEYDGKKLVSFRSGGYAHTEQMGCCQTALFQV